MQFSSDEHKTTFDVPDNPTGHVILAYEADIELQPGSNMYERLWGAACKTIQNWQGPVELSPDVLNDALPPASLAALKWASLAVFSWYLEWKRSAAPKN